ncbi:hypothetical protein Q0M83_14600, partial [Staphylococcus aureus]|nr:hypothetical protein [Staphylococcus aureus]
KPTQKSEVLKPQVDLYLNRTILGKESKDKSGLGSVNEKRVNNSPVDYSSLSKPGVGITPETLNQLESVQMVYHTGLKEYVMLYFMT